MHALNRSRTSDSALQAISGKLDGVHDQANRTLCSLNERDISRPFGVVGGVCVPQRSPQDEDRLAVATSIEDSW